MMILFLTTLFLISYMPAVFTLHFANYFGNGMVLQKAPNMAHVWGYASTVGYNVTVYVNGTVVASTKVTDAGKWSTLLPAHLEGGPYRIEIVSSEGRASLDDVWFGDVWICSGQSNMAFTLNHVYNYSEVIPEAVTFKNIRFIRLQQKTSNVTLEEPVTAHGWQAPANDYATKSFSAVCLLYAMQLSPHINRPIGLMQTTWGGGTAIESWSSGDALSNCASQNKRAAPQKNPSSLWNAMVAPILPMTIYGTIWYQGESNAGHSVDYNCSFSAMIDDWRKKFHEHSLAQTDDMFPFGFVQLAPSRNATFHGGFPDLRWWQTSGYGYVPNPAMQKVFMAVAMDLPDFHSPYGAIHPRDKQDVAIRLALAGRVVAYGETGIDFQGPFPSKVTHSNYSLVIEYDNGNGAIEVRTNRGFEICCSKTPVANCYLWIPAEITGHDQSMVVVDASVCHGGNPFPAAVRYAWELSPCDFKNCAIYGRDNDLPAPIFRRFSPWN